MAVLDEPGGLYALQHAALLRRDETGRYRLHPLIRDYALEKGAEAAGDAVDAGRERHSRYYLCLVSEQAATLQRGAPRELLAALQLEQDNLDAGWRHAVARNGWADIAASLDGVRHFYDHSGLFRSGADLFALALAAAPPTAPLVPDLLHARAALLLPVSEFEETLADLQSALDHPAVSRQTQVKCRLVWGLALDGQGDYEASLAQYQRAEELLAGGEQWLLLGRATQGIGWSLIQLGQAKAAGEPLQRALEFALRAGDRFGQMMTLTYLGVQARRRNRLADSERYYNQGLELARLLGERLVEGKLLANLGIAASSRYDLGRAQDYAEQALAIYEQLNVPHNLEITLGDLGVIHCRVGDFDGAQRHIEQSPALARQIQDHYGEAWALGWLSVVLLARGETGRAQETARAALATAERVGSRPLQAGALTKLAEACLARDELEAAAAGRRPGRAAQPGRPAGRRSLAPAIFDPGRPAPGNAGGFTTCPAPWLNCKLTSVESRVTSRILSVPWFPIWRPPAAGTAYVTGLAPVGGPPRRPISPDAGCEPVTAGGNDHVIPKRLKRRPKCCEVSPDYFSGVGSSV